MKKTFTIIILFLLCEDVFGDPDVKSLSVMAGGSVTLYTDITELQEDDVILWRFGEGESKILFAEITINTIWYARGSFKDKLQISDSQTGDLTIKNMKIKNSGLYEAEINLDTETVYKRFNVTVSESPSVINDGPSEVASFTVTEGESLVLSCNVQTQRDDLILWRFGDESVLIAEVDMEDNKTSVFDDDGRFRDRLKLNDQTGDLTITDCKPKHSGVYQLKIISNKQTLYKIFSVIVRESGSSSGGIAGLCVFFLLVIAAIIAAGLIFHRRKISKLKHEVKSVSVKGDQADVDVIDDLEVKSVSEVKGDQAAEASQILQKPQNSDGRKCFVQSRVREAERRADEFKEDVDVKNEVKSVPVKGDEAAKVNLNFLKRQNSGTDKVDKKRLKQQNSVCADVINEEMIRIGKTGGSVTLDTCVTEIQRDDEILWMFGDMTIALYTGDTNEYTLNKTDERFKDRLEMNHQSGDLTIRAFRSEYTGVYKVQIKNSSGNKERKFIVAFSVRPTMGCVILSTKVKIEEGDAVKWTSKDKTSLVSGMNGDDSKTSYTDDERFRERLKMNAQTGDLIIRDIRQTDEGVYTLKLIKADGKITYRIFNVEVTETIRKRKLKKSVPLYTKTQRHDEIGDTTSMLGDAGDSADVSEESVAVNMPLLNKVRSSSVM
ncbi:uncharacterized protein [Paramisgurnus dabryanus]|uniref:uncharacterized protein n=1 Tax=Paramisgurnus dabryanus TaxID=90735 RepID=UPI003CCFAC9E